MPEWNTKMRQILPVCHLAPICLKAMWDAIRLNPNEGWEEKWNQNRARIVFKKLATSEYSLKYHIPWYNGRFVNSCSSGQTNTQSLAKSSRETCLLNIGKERGYWKTESGSRFLRYKQENTLQLKFIRSLTAKCGEQSIQNNSILITQSNICFWCSYTTLFLTLFLQHTFVRPILWYMWGANSKNGIGHQQWQSFHL